LIEWPSIHITAPDDPRRELFALLLDDSGLSVMARRATGHEPIECGVRLTAVINANDVIDDCSDLKLARLQADFAQRMCSKLCATQSQPAFRVVDAAH